MLDDTRLMANVSKTLNELEEMFSRGKEAIITKDAKIKESEKEIRELQEKLAIKESENLRNLTRIGHLEETMREMHRKFSATLEAERVRYQEALEDSKLKHHKIVLKLVKDSRNELDTLETQLIKVKEGESDLKETISKLKEELSATKRASDQERSMFEKVKDELHQTKLSLLKTESLREHSSAETIKLKKELFESQERYKILKEQQSNAGAKLDEMHKMIIMNTSNRKLEKEVTGVKLRLGEISKENVDILRRIEDLGRLQRSGGRETRDSSSQTVAVKEDDPELTLRLREDLVEARNKEIETRQQNEVLRQVIRDIKRRKEEESKSDLAEEDEIRLRNLEQCVAKLYQASSNSVPKAPNRNIRKTLLPPRQ